MVGAGAPLFFDGALRALDGDVEVAALDRHRLARSAVVDDGDRERLAGDVGLVLAGGFEQVAVAAERELDPVLDLEARALAGVLDRVDDLAGEALAAQRVVELELQGDGVRALALELVALERA